VLFDILKFYNIKISANENSKFKKFFTVYEFITIDYISSAVENVKEFHPFVALTAGYSDQALSQKRDPVKFQASLMRLVTKLFESRVKFVMLVVPPPHRNNNTMEQWGFYHAIRKIFDLVHTKFPERTILVYLDDLFFVRRFPESDIVILDDDGYPVAINVQLKGNAYTKVSGSIVHFSREVVSDCLDKLMTATNEAKCHGKMNVNDLCVREVGSKDTLQPCPKRILSRGSGG
jgi:hypothetical protein